jgi:hypothetical protein
MANELLARSLEAMDDKIDANLAAATAILCTTLEST